MSIIHYPSEARYIGLSTDSLVGLSEEGAKVYFTDTQVTQICHSGVWTNYISATNTSIASSLPAGTNNIGVVNTQTLSGIVLNVASASIIVTTTSANLTVGIYKELAIDVNISVVTGTTPTYQIFIDRLGADGIYYNIYTGTSIVAVGVVSITVGVGASTNVGFGNVIRVREVVGGGTPSFTRSASIIGK
jgi:hypothetical protein